jgi:hypothetical protein
MLLPWPVDHRHVVGGHEFQPTRDLPFWIFETEESVQCAVIRPDRELHTIQVMMEVFDGFYDR